LPAGSGNFRVPGEVEASYMYYSFPFIVSGKEKCFSDLHMLRAGRGEPVRNATLMEVEAVMSTVMLNLMLLCFCIPLQISCA